ncbi:MAG: FG-GAP-like repeat-containing protein, partial [Bacteroidia bacterium]
MKKLLFGIISLCPIIAFAQPQITSISPTTGPVGTSVTITGSGFNTIADSNFVYFNDTTLASVTSATDSSLTVIVPTISSNGPIKVINLGNIDFSDQYYTYPALSTLPPPTISSFSPIQGQVGDVITINGTNFSAVPSDNIVYFGSVKAQVISSTSTQITVYLPNGIKYDVISVTVARQTAYSTFAFDVTFPVVDSSFVGSSFSQGVPFQDAGDRADSRNFADFDGDGKPDLCSINYQYVSILRNTSNFDDFSFAPAINITNNTPLASWFILPVDVDGDGKMDMVINNKNSFSVLKNSSTSGHLSFRPLKNFSTADIPRRWSDGEGLSDGSDYFGTLTGDTIVDPMQISAGDLDGDGKPDLAISFVQNGSNGFFAIYRNNTDNGVIDFSYSTILEGTSESTTIKDIDGDGKPDIIAVILQIGNSKISIYRNTSTPGNISFASRVDLLIPMGNGLGTINDNQINLADIDNDGKPDLILKDPIHDNFSVSLNQSSVGSITFAPPVYIATLDYANVSISDLNGDGKPDVVVNDQTPSYSGNISIYKNITIGSTIAFDTVIRFPAGAGEIFKICDVDMDGKPDILTQSGGFALYRNKANEPSIDSLGDPSSHLPLPAGTKQVVIKGDRFLGATSVTFNGISANSFIVDSKDQITAIVDTTAAATMRVRVESPLGIATLPVGSVYAPLANFCTSATASIIFKADNGIPPYKFQYKINGGAINTVSSGPGDSVIVHKSSSTAGTFTYSLINVTDKYGNGSKSSMNKTAVIHAVIIPPTPGAITGPTNVCSYMGSSSNAIYSIAALALANSYNWTVPAGATIISGQGTTSISVNYTSAFVSGNVAVQSVSGCMGAFKTLAITKTIPAVPGVISGPASVCSYVGTASTPIYTITAVANATSYNWTVPTGATIVSGAGTTSITVSYSTSFVPGNISVQSVSGCGSSAAKTLAITQTLPAAPTAITGPTNACPYMGIATNATYSITAVAGAASYNWTVPAGATIVAGTGTTSIDVSYSTAFVSGNVSVQSVAGCGSSAAKTLAITKTLPATPGTITGPVNACPFMGYATNAVYSIVPVSGVTTYNWTAPAGASIVSGQGTTSVNVSYTSGFVSGNISVQSVTNCGSSIAKTLAITKTAPLAPAAITGPAAVCFYMGSVTNATYS